MEPAALALDLGDRALVIERDGEGVAVDTGERPFVVDVEAVGLNGRDGERFTGFGFIDYSDPDAGGPLVCPAGEWVRLDRALVASAANDRLEGDFAGHAYWRDGLIRPRAAFESFAMAIAYKVKSYVTDGFVIFEVRPNGRRDLNQGPAPVRLFAEAGEVEGGFTSGRIINVRTTFATYGAELWVCMTRGGELLEVSPEFNPVGEGPA